MRPLRVMVYDKTCTTTPLQVFRGKPRRLRVGLSHSWVLGGWLYGRLGRLDRCAGFSDWASALAWLGEIERERSIGEIQFWGHGRWGQLLIDGQPLERSAVEPGHTHHKALSAVRERLSGADALWWFRTCETFGAERGHDFARAWTDFMGCRAAGHTYVIGPWQSGLHALEPGAVPHWSTQEGLEQGRPDAPVKAQTSGPRQPNTIHCLQGRVPHGW